MYETIAAEPYQNEILTTLASTQEKNAIFTSTNNSKLNRNSPQDK